MFIFTKNIQTRRLTAVAGEPVPPKYNTKWCRDDIMKRYGSDAIKEIPQAYREGGAKQMAEVYAKAAHERIKKLESENDALTKENCDLRAKLEAKNGQQSGGYQPEASKGKGKAVPPPNE